MKSTDHLALGRYLLDRYGTAGLRRHRRAFLIGCVEPDINIFSFLRGIMTHEKFTGHNAANSSAFVRKHIGSLESSGVWSAWDAFRLGTVLHYAADAFTYPHNSFWTGSLRQHILYEEELHTAFTAALRRGGEDPAESYELLRKAYCDGPPGIEDDCRCIMAASARIMRRCPRHDVMQNRQEDDLHEDPDNNRLVPASH